MAMASSGLPFGTVAPEFSLPDVRGGAMRSLDELAGARGTLIVFTCNHCPYVKHLRDGVAAFARDYLPKGLGMIGIAANDAVRYPDDAPEAIAREADAAAWTFPHLYDEAQTVARAYGAACTPEFFLFDAARLLVYRGRFDHTRPGQSDPVTGDELRRAADAVVAGGSPDAGHSAVGCGIKWIPGNEPRR
jgi:peroxiredoxin